MVNETLSDIRDARLDSLRNVAYMEYAIQQAGLMPDTNAMPQRLYQYFGGVKTWQYPGQLAPYLVLLSGLGITSYLEIGVAHGGTYAITRAYLKRFGLVWADALDIAPRSPLLHTYKDDMAYYQMATTDPRAGDVVGDGPGFYDLVLIDADHRPGPFAADVKFVTEVLQPRLMALHDADNPEFPHIRDYYMAHPGRLALFNRPEVENYNLGLAIIQLGGR